MFTIKIAIMILVTASGGLLLQAVAEAIEKRDLKTHQKTLIDHEKF